MTTPLLDVDGFKTRTVMPSEDVDYVESNAPKYLVARLAVNTGLIYARLAKRYAVPFTAPPPEIVLGWLVAMTTVDAYRKRGWNPADEQSKDILDDRTAALEQMKEAADAEKGLFDIPLREDTTATGITRGTPLAYSEASPYEWAAAQLEAVRGR